MRLGIIADTHDRLPAIEEAVKFFNAVALDCVVHAGDFIAPFTARKFAALKHPLIGVYGNNDGERQGLAAAYGGFASLHDGPYSFERGGVRIAVTHAPDKVEQLLADHEVVIYGHTHETEVRRAGRSVLVNPGECCGYLTGCSTVAIIDLRSLKVSLTKLTVKG